MIKGGLRSANATAIFAAGLYGEHTLVVTGAGALAPAQQPGDASALDEDGLLDVVVAIEFTVA